MSALAGPLLPGMPNLHSHAFQRAMAGLAEEALNPEDSFWTWRELMYRLVGRLTPEQVQAIATHLYIEMLKGGYTSVAEFHYLHHQPGGTAYANLAEMAERIVGAAEASGIGLTVLPAFYAHGGFGGQPLAEKQLRFKNDVARYLKLIEGVDRACRRIDARLGTVLPLAARRDRGRHEGGAVRAWRRAADPHPHRRADQGSAGLPRLVQPAAGGVAVRQVRDRPRAGA